MNHFMARLIFCFFAEDTGIFRSEGLFTATIDQLSARDSSNTHEVMGEVFRAMNTAIADRAGAGLRSWADAFPYVNGGLFSGATDCPRFSKIARSYLISIGSLDWKRINPDIFGLRTAVQKAWCGTSAIESRPKAQRHRPPTTRNARTVQPLPTAASTR